MGDKMLKHMVAAGLAALLATSAQAAVTFNVNATLATQAGLPAGTLTGTFTTNDALSMVTAFDLTASAAGAFAGYRYMSGTATVTAQVLPSQYFQLDSVVPGSELRLYFTTPLTTAGTTIATNFSYEAEPNSGANRLPTGTVTRQTAAVPEPASWAMMVVGFGAAGFLLRRRRRAEVAFA